METERHQNGNISNMETLNLQNGNGQPSKWKRKGPQMESVPALDGRAMGML